MRDILRAIVLATVFAVPFVALMVTNSQFFPFITGKNFMFRILVEVAFFAWIPLALLDKTYRPRFSWLLAAIAIFVGIIGLSAIFGLNPHKSFWSNYERMEGWITHIHLLAYFLVTTSILASRVMWDRFLNTMLIAAGLMLLYSFAQIGGFADVSQSAERLDARLGNAAYNAIYMLFHAFIAGLMFVRTKNKNLRILYGALALGFVYILFRTATRGAILGVTGGVFVSLLYIVLFGKEYQMLRKVSIGLLGAVVVLVALFFAVKDTEYIKQHQIFGRIATISLESGKTRFTIWSMAWEGVKERPLLGYGQENFNYVFNEEFRPSLYADEPWFDRVHNIFFDWLIAGGILGLLAYLSILFTALYYAVLRPTLRKSEEEFTVAERGLILGLFAGYFVHNIFVFDNIVSYILYFSVLAFIHVRVAQEIPAVTKRDFSAGVIAQVAVPLAAILGAATLYFVNIPGILASSDVIDAFRAPNAELRLEAFERALTRGSFADQEIREQMIRSTQQLLRDQNVPQEVRARMLQRSEEEALKQIVLQPDNARVRIFAGSLYRSAGLPAKAVEQYEFARELSPQKQQILFELGLSHLQMGNSQEAYEIFKEAHELEPRYTDARMLYAASALYVGDGATVDELITPEYEEEYLTDDLILRAAFDTEQFERVIDILEKRIELSPNDVQLRVSLAVSYNEIGNTDRAVEILEEAIEDFPDFEAQGRNYINDLRSGNIPQ